MSAWPNVERYIRIMAWAYRRYTVRGVLVVTRRGAPTRYARIETAAARKYLGVAS